MYAIMCIYDVYNYVYIYICIYTACSMHIEVHALKGRHMTENLKK